MVADRAHSQAYGEHEDSQAADGEARASTQATLKWIEPASWAAAIEILRMVGGDGTTLSLIDVLSNDSLS